jgi:RNA polymerase-binding transcription factor DksA
VTDAPDPHFGPVRPPAAPAEPAAPGPPAAAEPAAPELPAEVSAEAQAVAAERAEELAALRRAQGDLADVDRALARLDEGTYGTCEACGVALPDEVLAAAPAARTCAQHAVPA